jgi:hypothetical protein
MHWSDITAALQKLTDHWPDEGDIWHRGLLHLPVPTMADQVIVGGEWLLAVLLPLAILALVTLLERR